LNSNGRSASKEDARCAIAVLRFGLFLQYFKPTLTFARWSGWTWLLGPALTVFVLLLFPTGSLPFRRWRIVVWAALAGIACWIVGNAFAPMPRQQQQLISRPTWSGGERDRDPLDFDRLAVLRRALEYLDHAMLG
jgi:hypothetical protein